MSASAELQPSTFHFEPPDLCVWTLGGEVSAEAVRAVTAAQQRVARGLPYILVLVDVSRVESISAEARREAAEEQPGVNVGGVACVGASFPVRVLATLVNKAAAMTHNHKSYPMRFFATPAHARAWLAERRRELSSAGR